MKCWLLRKVAVRKLWLLSNRERRPWVRGHVQTTDSGMSNGSESLYFWFYGRTMAVGWGNSGRTAASENLRHRGHHRAGSAACRRKSCSIPLLSGNWKKYLIRLSFKALYERPGKHLEMSLCLIDISTGWNPHIIENLSSCSSIDALNKRQAFHRNC